MTTAQNNDVVEINYTLKNDGGETLDDSVKSSAFIYSR